MNKARMTFRFDEGQGRQLEEKEQTETFEQPVQQFRGFDENSHHDPKPPDRTVRDKLSVIPGSMQGWGDPFSREDNWDGMMTGGSPYREQIPHDDDYRQNDKLSDLYDLDDIYYGGDDLTGQAPGGSIQEIGEISTGGYMTYRPRRTTSLWKIIGTVTGAVITGALFGFVVLSFFKDGSGDTSINTIDQSQKNTISVSSNESPAGEANAAVVAVDIKPQSYYMLQYGVFSSADRVEQAKEELKQYGIAAGNDPDQENRVYAGISTDREQAKLLSNQLKAQGMELYVREIALPAAASVHFNGDADTVDQYFTSSSELVALLSQTSASLLGKDQPAPLAAEETAALTDLHREWTEASKSFQTGLNSDEEAMGKQLETTMNSALSSLEEYNKNRAKGHLWEIQSSMMQYIIQQKELMAMLEK